MCCDIVVLFDDFVGQYQRRVMREEIACLRGLFLTRGGETRVVKVRGVRVGHRRMIINRARAPKRPRRAAWAY